MSKIFLIGFMGSGKTSVGKHLAALLNQEFIDLDEVIEKNEGKTISEIFQENGEDYFREKESQSLKSLTEKSDAIVATGGGAPCFFDSVKWMNENGITVYLKTDAEILFRRLVNEANHRPLLKSSSPDELKKFITKKLNERKLFYESAKISIDTSLINEQEIALQLVQLLQ